MGLLTLFLVASLPVLKVLLICALGSFLALDHIDILGESSRKQLNNVVFYVFNPALVSSNLAGTITLENITLLWFMPLNILLTFILGSLLGWVLTKIVKSPQHLKGLVLGSCAAGNLGNLPLIIIPAICREKSSPFGAPDSCHMYGMAYASLSLAIGAIYLWSYVYNIVRITSINSTGVINLNISNSDEEASESLQEQLIDKLDSEERSAMDHANESMLPCAKTNKKGKVRKSLDHVAFIIHRILSNSDEEASESLQEQLIDKLDSEERSAMDHANESMLPCAKTNKKGKVLILNKIEEQIRICSRNVNLKAIFAPSTTAAIVGFIIGLVPPVRKLIIGANAPLHVIQDSASLVGEAAIPIVTLIVGGNLLKGLTGSGIQLSLIVGIITIRYLLLPVIGVFVIKGAVRWGLVHADPLYQFVLLLQYALPPAMNIGTIMQLFGAGQSECSVILLWTYSIASVSLTLWSTYFMWLVS